MRTDMGDACDEERVLLSIASRLDARVGNRAASSSSVPSEDDGRFRGRSCRS